MSYGYDQDLALRGVVYGAEASERAVFIRRTYAHLGGAVLAFIGLEALLVKLVPREQIFGVFGNSPYAFLLILGGFMLASWVAQVWARSETSRLIQYAGLALYVCIEALIMLPLISYASFAGENRLADPFVIPEAGILSLCVFGGLTAAVFITRKDYSFLGPMLGIASFLVLGMIVIACLFGLSLGTWFSFGMIALMSGFILYQTSNVMLHYRTDQYVAASLALFSSLATLFYYVLRILLMSRR